MPLCLFVQHKPAVGISDLRWDLRSPEPADDQVLVVADVPVVVVEVDVVGADAAAEPAAQVAWRGVHPGQRKRLKSTRYVHY